MSWTCPTCKRTFTRNRQAHSCEKHELSALFADKPEFIRTLFDYLLEQIKTVGPMEVHVAKWNVTLRSATTFVTIIPEKKDLIIRMAHQTALDDFPVYDSHQYSKNRWANLVKIENKEEVDSQLIAWIKDAYELCS